MREQQSSNLYYTEARGPCYARYSCSTLYQGETYFVQTDSHTGFLKNTHLILEVPDGAGEVEVAVDTLLAVHVRDKAPGGHDAVTLPILTGFVVM